MKRNWTSANSHGIHSIKREHSFAGMGKSNRRKRRKVGYGLAMTELPDHVFVKKKISLQVWVKDRSKSCIAPVDGVYIACELLNEDGTQAAQGLIRVRQQNIVARQGRAICDITLLGLSSNHGNQRFKLRFHTIANIHGLPIEDCESRLFRVIARRIQIIQQPTTVWYKDEGGKTAALECKYQLVDADNRVIAGGKPKVNPQLLFDNGEQVPTKKKTDGKEIFKLMEHGKARSGSSGMRIVRWRVEDVSRSHGLQKFKLHLRADPSNPDSFDIASAYTDATEVKSKRKTTKSRRSSLNGGGGPAGMITQAAILQHMDNALTRWLKPLGDRITRIEHSINHVVQKIDRVEHHLGIAPEGAMPSGMTPHPGRGMIPAISTPATLHAGGGVMPSHTLPSPSSIGNIPPAVNYGGVGDLPALQRNITNSAGGQDMKSLLASSSGEIKALLSSDTAIPGLPPLPVKFPSIVQDVTDNMPPVNGISRQKSASGYPAFQNGELKGFFQTTSLSAANNASSLSFTSIQDLGLGREIKEKFQSDWASEQMHAPGEEGSPLRGDDPGLLKGRLIRKISGQNMPPAVGAVPALPQAISTPLTAGDPAVAFAASADVVSNSQALDRDLARDRDSPRE